MSHKTRVAVDNSTLRPGTGLHTLAGSKEAARQCALFCSKSQEKTLDTSHSMVLRFSKMCHNMGQNGRLLPPRVFNSLAPRES